MNNAKEYKVTKAQLEKKLSDAGRVCDYCGRYVAAIETEDNGGSPTYWAGCFHGKEATNTSLRVDDIHEYALIS